MIVIKIYITQIGPVREYSRNAPFDQNSFGRILKVTILGKMVRANSVRRFVVGRGQTNRL